MKVCPSCARENPDDARFCSGCATPLDAPAGREERKVVTVLFCDLVGSTAQAERLDPEDVRALLSRYHERVKVELERFGGTVEKFIGDAVMALFGAPVAHEDDPERAVRAALAVREWAEEEGDLQVRIGITTGEALVTVEARPGLGEGMAAGDVVNTAARLQGAAPENGILVDETTFHATERAIEYGEPVAVSAKGKTDPVRAREALQARSRFGTDVRQIGRTPLVGRLHELDVLLDALARVRRDREPQLVTLVGVPGIGKSRLVWELFQRLDAEGGLTRWRQGRSLPYGEGVSYWALGEMVKAEAGILETDSAEQVAAKLRSMFDALTFEESEWVERHLRPLLGLEAAGELGGDRREEAFAAWRRLLEALGEHRPTVLVFEDLHWADDGLLDFVDHVVDRASGVPLLVIGTARPELLARRPNWGGGKANAITLSLPPLSDDETSLLVGSLLDRSFLAAEVKTSLLERAEGNPLYAEEFVRLVSERPEATLPESVQGIIAARLDGLPVAEKELVQVAAVYGKVFWLGGLVNGRARWTVEEILHSLERKEFVRRERRGSVAGELEYAFRHALVRDVAYEQIPRSRRADMHVAAAEWIESLGRPDDHSEMLAHHYLAAYELARAAGEPAEDLATRAHRALRSAGDRAYKLNAFTSAVAHYRTALELWPEAAPGRADVLFQLASALHTLSAGDEETMLERARAELLAEGDKGRAAEASVMLAELWWLRGRRTAVDEQLAAAQELVQDQSPSSSKARVLANVSRYLMLAGDDDAVAVGREALAMAEELGLDELRAHSLNNIGVARTHAGDEEGLADLERSIELARAASSPELARAYNNLASVLFSIYGLVRRSYELWLECIRVGEQFGNGIIARFASGVLLNFEYFGGRWDDHTAKSDAWLAANAEGATHQDLYISARQSAILLARGEDERALESAGRAVERAREVGDPQALGPALTELARVHAELGDVERAREAACEALPIGARWPELLAPLALIADRVGIHAELAAIVAVAPARSLWTAGARPLLEGDFVRAADVFVEMEIPPYEALARLRAAEQLVAQGRRTEADEHVQRALAFWRSVRATRYIREAEALLPPAD
jgi:class 3 adenylate cyclase/tetratricopeptide (TPR) repeat protein